MPCARPSSSLWSVFDVAHDAEELRTLEEQSTQPDFWNNPDAAQRTMRRLSRLKTGVAVWNDTLQRISDATELAEMADDSMAEDLAREADELRATVDHLVFRAKLSGQYDVEDA